MRFLVSLLLALALIAPRAALGAEEDALRALVEKQPEHPIVEQIRQDFLKSVADAGKAPEQCSLKQVEDPADPMPPHLLIIVATCKTTPFRCYYGVDLEAQTMDQLSCVRKPVEAMLDK